MNVEGNEGAHGQEITGRERDVSIVRSVGTSKGEERGVIAGRDTKFTVTWPVACRSGTDQHAGRFDAPSEFHRLAFVVA